MGAKQAIEGPGAPSRVPHPHARNLEKMIMKTFDVAAVARPYPFLGTVARGDASVLDITIDTMVTDAGNVTDEEAASIWGLGASHIAKIDSRSATDISDLAFRAHRGSVHAHKRAITDEVAARWEAMASDSEAAGLCVELARIEAACGNAEMRRELLRHAAFFEGYKLDTAGQVRRACAARAGCLNHPAAAVYLATGEGDVDDIAVKVLRPPERRKRTTSAASSAAATSELRTACAALLASSLSQAGLSKDGSAAELALLATPPATLALVIAAVEAHVKERKHEAEASVQQ